MAFIFLFINHPAFGTPPKIKSGGEKCDREKILLLFQGGVPRRMSREVVICLKTISL